MIIRPQQKLRDLVFYNNLIFILIAFSIVCFFTSINFSNLQIKSVRLPNRDNVTVGPIKVNDKAQIYKIKAHWFGRSDSSYLTGEVLDEEKDTIYEFGKDFWFEEGYDADGYWSEDDRNMTAYLTFKEKGTYYIQFSSENNDMRNVEITLALMRGSYIAHSMVGALALLFALIAFFMFNWGWCCEAAEWLNEKLEEMSDED